MEKDDDKVSVRVETHLGAVYEFPDMSFRVLWTLIQSDTFLNFPSMSLVNISEACLVLPTRIIARILVNGEEHWTAKKEG